MRYAALLLCISFCITGASSCSRKKDDLFKKVDADVWLHEQIPAELCVGDLQTYGIYRNVNCTDSSRVAGLCGPEDKTYEEFIPYCAKEIKVHIGMHKDHFKKWVDLAKERIDECF